MIQPYVDSGEDVEAVERSRMMSLEMMVTVETVTSNFF